MPVLYITTPETVAMLEAEGQSLKIVTNVDTMSQQLSPLGMAEMELAFKAFPFQFDAELGIELAPPPLARLAVSGEHESLMTRVSERVETEKLKETAAGEKFTPVYTLNPVDENTWVAVQQRLHDSGTDPSNRLLSSNQGFFDELIAQALHVHSFEKVSASNIFRYYLGSLPQRKVA
jgi:hypothetical protein